jgi:hypothetical protein
MKRCHSCSNTINENAKFCPKCGAIVSDSLKDSQSSTEGSVISGSDSSRVIPPPPPSRPAYSGAPAQVQHAKSGNKSSVFIIIGAITLVAASAIGLYLVSNKESGDLGALEKSAEETPLQAEPSATASPQAQTTQAQQSQLSVPTQGAGQGVVVSEQDGGSAGPINEYEYYYVTGLDPNGDNWLAIKQAPNMAAPRIGKLPPNAEVKVVGETVGQWVPIQTTDAMDQKFVNVRGWVSRQFLSPQKASAKPSFDCNKASSYSEKLICSDPELARMDVELAGIYRQAKAIASDQKEFTRRSAARWKDRESTCYDRACVVDWYQSRKQELQDEIAQGGQY